MSAIHIHAPNGYFLGQVRAGGAHKWRTVTQKCKTWNSALSRAVMKMEDHHKRARVIYVVESGYYDPTVIAEASK